MISVFLLHQQKEERKKPCRGYKSIFELNIIKMVKIRKVLVLFWFLSVGSVWWFPPFTGRLHVAEMDNCWNGITVQPNGVYLYLCVYTHGMYTVYNLSVSMFDFSLWQGVLSRWKIADRGVELLSDKVIIHFDCRINRQVPFFFYFASI